MGVYNAVNVYAMSQRHYPDKVTEPWMVANPSRNRFMVAPRIECDCGRAVEVAHVGQCEQVLLAGQRAGAPMYHLMGRYNLQMERYNKHPVYRNVTKRYGSAYLYFESTPDGKRYWVVGPKVGSKGVNIYAPDEAAMPDLISSDWLVADEKDGVFTVAPRIEARCAQHERFGFEHISDFRGKVLRIDAELADQGKESFGAGEAKVLAEQVAGALGLPARDVRAAQTQAWSSKVGVELRIHVRTPRVAEAAIVTMMGRAFATRVANKVGTQIGGAPITNLQFSFPSLVADTSHGGSGMGHKVGALVLLGVAGVVGTVVWVQCQQKSRKKVLGRERKYRSLAAAPDDDDAEQEGLVGGGVGGDLEADTEQGL
eukprot:g7194.t1